MNKTLAGLALGMTAMLLGGCYYEPGYSYVRGGGGADAYYGRGATAVYDDGYYASPGYYAPGYYDGYYGGYYGQGCCYSSGVVLGVGRGWYGGSGYRGYDRRGYDRHHVYRGRPDSGWHGNGRSDSHGSRGSHLEGHGGGSHSQHGRHGNDHNHR